MYFDHFYKSKNTKRYQESTAEVAATALDWYMHPYIRWCDFVTLWNVLGTKWSYSLFRVLKRVCRRCWGPWCILITCGEAKGIFGVAVNGSKLKERIRPSNHTSESSRSYPGESLQLLACCQLVKLRNRHAFDWTSRFQPIRFYRQRLNEGILLSEYWLIIFLVLEGFQW